MSEGMKNNNSLHKVKDKPISPANIVNSAEETPTRVESKIIGIIIFLILRTYLAVQIFYIRFRLLQAVWIRGIVCKIVVRGKYFGILGIVRGDCAFYQMHILTFVRTEVQCSIQQGAVDFEV